MVKRAHRGGALAPMSHYERSPQFTAWRNRYTFLGASTSFEGALLAASRAPLQTHPKDGGDEIAITVTTGLKYGRNRTLLVFPEAR